MVPYIIVCLSWGQMLTKEGTGMKLLVLGVPLWVDSADPNVRIVNLHEELAAGVWKGPEWEPRKTKSLNGRMLPLPVGPVEGLEGGLWLGATTLL